ARSLPMNLIVGPASCLSGRTGWKHCSTTPGPSWFRGSTREFVRGILLLCCLGWSCSFEARASAVEHWHAGFLSDQFSLTLDAGTRTEALGPFYYDEERESEHVFAVPPLF